MANPGSGSTLTGFPSFPPQDRSCRADSLPPSSSLSPVRVGVSCSCGLSPLGAAMPDRSIEQRLDAIELSLRMLVAQVNVLVEALAEEESEPQQTTLDGTLVPRMPDTQTRLQTLDGPAPPSPVTRTRAAPRMAQASPELSAAFRGLLGDLPDEEFLDHSEPRRDVGLGPHFSAHGGL